MRAIFALIGLLFDLIILAAAGFALYCTLQPQVFYDSLVFVNDYFDMDYSRIRIAGVALAFLTLSFRGIFLLLLGSSDKTFVISRGENGLLSVSRTTLEHLIGQLAGKLNPPSDIKSLSISQSGKGVKISLKIMLDLTNCNLSEYSNELDKTIRTYFQQSLGVDVEKMDIQAVASRATKAQPPAVVLSD